VKRVSKAGLCFFGLSLLALSGLAQSERPIFRPVKINWTAKAPAVTFDGRDFLDTAIRQRLKSGLPQLLVTRVVAVRDGRENRPVAFSMLSCRVVYDLWEEVFQIRVQRGAGTQEVGADSPETVARYCLAVNQLMVGTETVYEKLRGKPVFFTALIEFNPMSDGTVERIRRWIARSGGSGKLTGDAFFGSFVSRFLDRKMGSAERSVSYRSQAVLVPAGEP